MNYRPPRPPRAYHTEGEGTTMSDLTPKLEHFCEEIVQGRSQSDAYRLAFRPKRSQPKTIHEEASKLMAHPKVATRVAELRAPVVESVRLTMQQRLNELQNAILFNPKDYFDEHGQPLPIKDLPDHVAKAIAGYEVDAEKFTTKVKFMDRRAAIMDYSKLMGDIPGDKKPPAAPPVKEYDPHQLTAEEWAEYKRIRSKALVGPVEGG